MIKLDINHWLVVKWWMMENYPNFKYLPTFKSYVNQMYMKLYEDFMSKSNLSEK